MIQPPRQQTHYKTETRVKDTAEDLNIVIHQNKEITEKEGEATLEADRTAGKTEEETDLKEEAPLTEANLQTETQEEILEEAQDPRHHAVCDLKEITSAGIVTSQATKKETAAD